MDKLIHSEEKRRQSNNKAGLKSLIHSKEKLPPRILHCYNLNTESKPPPPLPSPMPLWSSLSVMGDVIGSESGDCMVAVEEVEVKAKTTSQKGKLRIGKKREFPPLITLMRETGRMPWTFKKEYSDDGRFILRAERLNRHDYVESSRENGRLTMRLVEDGSNVYCEECECLIMEEVEMEDLEFNEEPEELGLGLGLECVDNQEEEEEEEEEGYDLGQKLSEEKDSDELCGDFRQCVTYDGGWLKDSESFCKGTPIGHSNSFLGRPGSAPLRPMTPVM